MAKGGYVLITPARNEEEYIKNTIESVVTQTVQPAKWIIVSDGSVDRTDEVVKEYEKRFKFIKFLRVDEKDKRSFSSKVFVFKAGYDLVKESEFDFVGNLDADVTIPSNYYERMIYEFGRNTNLGVAGGVVMDKVRGGGFKKSISHLYHTAGAIQLFRRKCYEEIGGYMPLRTGGIDSYALIMARLNGWETRMFRDVEVLHHRQEGTVLGGGLRVRFRQGKTDYNLGTHPLFALVKFVRRCQEKPYVISSMARLAGFLTCSLRRTERDVSEDFIKYYRGEQISRLKGLFTRGRGMDIEIVSRQNSHP